MRTQNGQVINYRDHLSGPPSGAAQSVAAELFGKQTPRGLRHYSTSDTDGDGARDWQEWIAGTDPMNAEDVFKITAWERVAETGALLIRWNTRSNRVYRVYEATDLLGPWNVVYQVSGDGQPKSFTNAPVLPGPQFLRLGVEREP